MIPIPKPFFAVCVVLAQQRCAWVLLAFFPTLRSLSSSPCPFLSSFWCWVGFGSRVWECGVRVRVRALGFPLSPSLRWEFQFQNPSLESKSNKSKSKAYLVAPKIHCSNSNSNTTATPPPPLPPSVRAQIGGQRTGGTLCPCVLCVFCCGLLLLHLVARVSDDDHLFTAAPSWLLQPSHSSGMSGLPETKSSAATATGMMWPMICLRSSSSSRLLAPSLKSTAVDTADSSTASPV